MKYQQTKGNRFKNQFSHVVVDDFWWSNSEKTWVKSSELKDVNFSLLKNCGSLRAFRKMLKKHPQIQGKATLCSNFLGYDVFA